MYVISQILQYIGKKLIKLSYILNKNEIYDENSKFTYAVGETLVMDLINYTPKNILKIYIKKNEKKEILNKNIIEPAKKNNIPIIYTNKIKPFNYNSKNFRVSAQVRKIEDKIFPGSHIVIVNPAVEGNVGAIIRSALAFGIYDVAILGSENFDTNSPWLIRSSMGARLKVRVECFKSIREYMDRFPDNTRYAFMLDGKQTLRSVKVKKPFSLIFGNETNGLPQEFSSFCQTVFIEQNRELDSLNVSVSAAIAAYVFNVD